MSAVERRGSIAGVPTRRDKLTIPHRYLPHSNTVPTYVEILDVHRDSLRYRGRFAARNLVLTMTPDDLSDTSIVAPDGPVDGVGWGVKARNDLTLALRIQTFTDLSAARADAVSVLGQTAQFRFVPVSHPASGWRSLWVVLNGKVVLAGGNMWKRQASSLEPSLKRLLGVV